MIPDYQTLMRSVLACALDGEFKIGDAVERLAEMLGLTHEERAQLLPSVREGSADSESDSAKTRK